MQRDASVLDTCSPEPGSPDAHALTRKHDTRKTPRHTKNAWCVRGFCGVNSRARVLGAARQQVALLRGEELLGVIDQREHPATHRHTLSTLALMLAPARLPSLPPASRPPLRLRALQISRRHYLLSCSSGVGFSHKGPPENEGGCVLRVPERAIFAFRCLKVRRTGQAAGPLPETAATPRI